TGQSQRARHAILGVGLGRRGSYVAFTVADGLAGARAATALTATAPTAATAAALALLAAGGVVGVRGRGSGSGGVAVRGAAVRRGVLAVAGEAMPARDLFGHFAFGAGVHELVERERVGEPVTAHQRHGAPAA